MKLNCKRIDLPYTPGEEIFTFPEDTGLPFLFDVEEELTGDPAAMDAVGEMLDEAETLAEKAKAAIKAALAFFDATGLLAGGIGLLIGSGSMTRRHRRYASYLRIAGKRSSISVASLARAAEVSERRAERDLQAMLV